VRERAAPTEALAQVESAGGEGVLFDAVEDAAFRRHLADAFARGWRVEGGESSWVVEPLGTHPLVVPLEAPIELVATEQSNTSIRFADEGILKLFPRREPGEHPDVEIGRVPRMAVKRDGVPTNDVWLREGMPDTLFTIEATTAEMAMHMGRWAAEEGGFERVATVCSDYVTGWETCGGFVNTFTTYGGEIVEQLWPPAGGAPDYAPLISRLEAVDYDAIYMGTPVGDGVLFFTALSEFGLADETQILGHKVVIDPGTLAAYGAEAAGILSSAPYAEGADRIAEFVEAYEEEYGELPGTTGGAKYFIAQLIDTALQELGGEVPENASEFIDVLENIELTDSIYGNWTTDDDGNAIHDHYLREVVDRGDGTLWNVVNEEWEGRGPGYVFDVDAYFDQPPYSQDYQGIGWPESCDDFVDEADCPADLQ
jgi:ABC-type branched-subunit amino acid transport system substrate-binding protein